MSRIGADRLLKVLKDAGLQVKEVGDWRRHNRDHKGPWNPRGIMWHHTASTGSVASQVRLLRDGRSGLPGPLCHIGLAPDGVVWLIGYGRANHAGKGDAAVLRAILDERPRLPRPGYDSVDGNAAFYGIEVMHEGTHPKYPTAQIDALVRLTAAICAAHGWTQNSVLHHREWTRRKIDMSWRGDGREEVAKALALGPARYRYGNAQEDDIVASLSDLRKVIREEADVIAKAVADADVYPNKSAPEGSTNPTWTLKRMVSDIEHTQDQMRQQLRELPDLVRAIVREEIANARNLTVDVNVSTDEEQA